MKAYEMPHSLLKARLLLVSLFALTASPALAYIGPGAGVGAIVVTVALVIGVLLLAVGLIWFPLKRMLKGKKGSKTSADNSSQQE